MPAYNDPDAVNTAIRGVLTTLLASDPNYFRPANQNAPTGRVNQPFAEVMITEFTPSGQDVRRLVDEGVEFQLTQYIEGIRHILCDVQPVRANAYQTASRINALMRSDVAGGVCHAAGLGFIRAGTARNLSQTVDTFWEERAQVVLEFYCSSCEKLVIPTIASVVINIDVDGQSVSREVNLDVNP